MNPWTRWTVGGSLTLALLPATLAVAAAPPPGPDAAAPAAVDALSPQEREVRQWIEQLGAPAYRDREAAARELERIGPAALPQLERAAAGANPEIVARAESLVKRLTRRPVPPQAGLPGGAGLDTVVRIRIGRGVRTINALDRGRRVQIVEGPDGIDLAVTGADAAGREVTEHFKATDADDLRRRAPEAARIYDRWSRAGGQAGLDGGGAFIWRHAVGNGQAGPDPINPIVPLPPQPIDPLGPFVVGPLGIGGLGIGAGADDLQVLRDRVARQLRAAGAPIDQQQQVMQQIERLMRAQMEGLAIDDLPKRMEQYNRLSDDLRRKLEELKLPDPGDVLPPPAKSRLGISIDPFGDDLRVKDLLPDGRGAKMGLRPGDVIEKVNGKRVADTRELRRAITDVQGKLVLEGLRDGRPLKLQEE